MPQYSSRLMKWRFGPPDFTQSNVQAPVPEVCPPLPVCTQASTLPQTQYFAVPDDLYVYREEDLAADPPPAQEYGYGLASSASPPPSVALQSAEEGSEVFSSDDDEADEFLPVCPLRQLNNPECVFAYLSSGLENTGKRLVPLAKLLP